MTPTKVEQNAAKAAMLEADARNQLAELKLIARDDILHSEYGQEAARLGLGTAPVKATNDADHYLTLYHAYDDRTVEIPFYMAPQRLTERFPKGTPDKPNTEIPEEFQGMQVWLLANDPRRPVIEDRVYQCRLSVKAPDEFKTAMQAAGLTPNCRLVPKGGGFRTQFEADEHMRVKHPRRYRAWTIYRGEHTQTAAADRLQETVAALLKGIVDAKS